jgi:hypothetical protein
MTSVSTGTEVAVGNGERIGAAAQPIEQLTPTTHNKLENVLFRM